MTVWRKISDFAGAIGDAGEGLLDDLHALLERLGVRSLDEIRGCARVEVAPEA